MAEEGRGGEEKRKNEWLRMGSREEKKRKDWMRKAEMEKRRGG
jgi:hypothetical protein